MRCHLVHAFELVINDETARIAVTYISAMPQRSPRAKLFEWRVSDMIFVLSVCV
jgi:hypothetical protein